MTVPKVLNLTERIANVLRKLKIVHLVPLEKSKIPSLVSVSTTLQDQFNALLAVNSTLLRANAPGPTGMESVKHWTPDAKMGLKLPLTALPAT